MTTGAITREAVLAAIGEHDNNPELFRETYKFGAARDYLLAHNGRDYDSKAILNVAYKHATGVVGNFRGGKGPGQCAHRAVELGFTVVDRSTRTPLTLGGDHTQVPTTARRNPAWVREEIILACALYVEAGWNRLDHNNPKVLELSALLRGAPYHDARNRLPNFRNNHAVSHKMSDLKTAHPDYPADKVQMKGGRLALDIVREFVADTQGMLDEAAAIRASLTAAPTIVIPAQLGADRVARGPVKHVFVNGKRIQRHSTRSETVKRHYEDVCQICRTAMRTSRGTTSDGAHIRALKDGGPDHQSNIVCLCGSCHREYDHGGIYIDDDLAIRATADGSKEGDLFLKDGHTIDRDHLRYQRAKFGLDSHPEWPPRTTTASGRASA